MDLNLIQLKMFSFLVILCSINWLTLGVTAKGSSSAESMAFPLLMPDVQPTQKETYLCTAFKMHSREHQYIVEFKPNASMNTAHHILIYGCKIPGYHERDTPRVVWDCGEMANFKSEYVRAPTCQSGSQIIYAWAMDAPALTLPEGVGFKVGGDTDVNYLVLQVHYATVDHFLNGISDNSGIILTLLPKTTEKVNKRAGVLVLGTGGMINKQTIEHMETTCAVEEDLELHPFAFRTHTHKLGKVVSGFRITPDGHWTMIGRHNPQKPQMFYPVRDNSLVIRKDDVLAARCTMNNTHDHIVSIGSTGKDEMCNFYLMYYVNGDEILERKMCFSAGPPFYYWYADPLIQRNGNIPRSIDIEASRLSTDEE